MEITKEHREPFTVLKIAGDFDVRHSSIFKKCLKGIFDEGEYRIIVDLNDVGFFDSSGNGELIYGMKKCQKNAGQFFVVSKNEKVNRVIRKLKIHSALNLCGEIEDAIRIAKG